MRIICSAKFLPNSPPRAFIPPFSVFPDSTVKYLVFHTMYCISGSIMADVMEMDWQSTDLNDDLVLLYQVRDWFSEDVLRLIR